MQCIVPSAIKNLREAIVKNGGFSGLRGMTAQQRVDFFKKYVDLPGESSTAEWLNREIERRILQPGQVAAAKEWIRNLEKKDVKITNKKALLDRIAQKKEVFKPKGFFAEGLAKQALGFEISRDNIKKLYDLSVSIDEYKKRLLALDPKYLKRKTAELKELPENVQNARAELGQKLVEFQKEYEAISLQAQLTDYANKNLSGKAKEIILRVAGNIKSLKASLDVSFMRQLWSVLEAGQTKTFANAMKSGYKVFFGKSDWADTLMGELLTRPNALANRYSDFGVEVGIKEEAFPESWISKLIDKTPLENLNLFRRSEAAFNTSIQVARADLFDWMWEQSNGDIKLLHDQNVGKAINLLTGRGSIPILTPKDPESQRVINNLLFAPKWLASRIQLITDAHFNLMSGNKITVNGKTVLTPQGLRAKAALGNIIMIAIAAATRRLLWGLEEDTDYGTMLDPRSTDFGKVIIGRTRFDLTAGTASLITFATRLGFMESTTAQGRVRPAKPGDLWYNFLSGKSSPGLQFAEQLIHAGRIGLKEGRFETVDWRGKPVKWESKEEALEALAEMFLPISLTGGVVETFRAPINGERLDNEYWGMVAGIVADFVGIGANTYDKNN